MQHVEAVLQLLSVMTGDYRFEDVLNDPDGPEGGINTMCDVLDRVEARGEAKGIQRGIDQNRIESIKNVMESFKVTAQQAMEALKIPTDDQPKYLAKL